MLTGQNLGAAIKAAIKQKKITQKTLAEAFGVKQPSVQDWIKRGTISKDKLPKLWKFFEDVVGPEHWGLASYPTSHCKHEFPMGVQKDIAANQLVTVELSLLRINEAIQGLDRNALTAIADCMQSWVKNGGGEPYLSMISTAIDCGLNVSSHPKGKP